VISLVLSLFSRSWAERAHAGGGTRLGPLARHATAVLSRRCLFFFFGAPLLDRQFNWRAPRARRRDLLRGSSSSFVWPAAKWRVSAFPCRDIALARRNPALVCWGFALVCGDSAPACLVSALALLSFRAGLLSFRAGLRRFRAGLLSFRAGSAEFPHRPAEFPRWSAEFPRWLC